MKNSQICMHAQLSSFTIFLDVRTIKWSWQTCCWRCSLFADGTFENPETLEGMLYKTHIAAYWREEPKKNARRQILFSRVVLKKKTGNAELAELMYKAVGRWRTIFSHLVPLGLRLADW